MALHPVRCDAARLKALLDERLGEGEQAELAVHLEECALCRGALEELAAASRWWGEARLLGDEASGASGPDAGDAREVSLDFLDPPAEPGQLGRLGPYEVVEVIGRGGMGVVLKALDRPLGRFVAIKVLAPELATSATARRRFAREARAVAAISHEHIVAVHSVDATPAGLPYIVMHLVSGRSLQDRLDQLGPFEIQEVLRVGRQAASGLAAAHAVGLVHRDVKPANILLENCVERVKLTDFGLARAADDASLTRSGIVAGTPQYMAPEQARGEAIDSRADLFSLGSVLYTLCTGRPPFRAETTMGVLRRVSDDTPRPIREVNPAVPDWLEAIVAKLQAKDPADRFQTAAEVAELFGRCLAYLEQPGPEPPFAVARRRGPGPGRPKVIAATLLLLAAFAGLGASEASGVTRLTELIANVIRIPTRDGALILLVDDPEVKVRVDDKDVVLTDAHQQEIRLSLRAGSHLIQKTKDGMVRQELVSITRGGKQTVRVSFEPTPAPVAAPPPPTPPPPSQLQARIKALEEENRRIESDRLRMMKEYRRAWKEDPERHRPGSIATPALTWPVPVPSLLPRARRDSLTGHRIWSLAIAPDGRTLALGSGVSSPGVAGYSNDQGALTLMDLREGRDRWVPPGDAAPSPRVDPTPDRVTERLKVGLLIEPRHVRCVVYSPDGRLIATAEHDGTARLREARRGGTIRCFVGHGAGVNAVAFSPDGKTLATAGLDRTVRTWDVGSGREIRKLLGHSDPVFGVAFGPDGRTLASCGGDETVRLWDLETGECRALLVGHRDKVEAVAFSPDGRILASASWDRSVRFWDPRDGRLLATLAGHGSAVLGLAFSPDGRTLATSGGPWGPDAPSPAPGELRLWHVATRSLKLNLTGHRDRVFAVGFSPDGRTLASASWDGLILLWDLPPTTIAPPDPSAL